VSGVSREARLLLIACSSFADDAGRLVWVPGVLREQAFGADGDLVDAVVAGWMAELVAAGLVRVFVVEPGARVFGVLVGFAVDQRVVRPSRSRLPVPPWESCAADADAGAVPCVDGVAEQPPSAQPVAEVLETEVEGVDVVSAPMLAVRDAGDVSESSETMAGAPEVCVSADDESEIAVAVLPVAGDGLSEEDEMGLYDKAGDPFASVTPVAVLERVTPQVAVQQVLVEVPVPVPAPAGDDAAPGAGAPKAKRKSRKKAAGEQTVLYAPEVEVLCERLAEAVRRNMRAMLGDAVAGRVKVTETWRDAADKLLRLDGFTAEEVTALIDWTAQDTFWRGNVRSMPKLREQVERLAMDQKFLVWARQNRRATRAAANGVVLPTGTGAQKTRAVDQIVDVKGYDVDGF
jgi:hypothetical protein